MTDKLTQEVLNEVLDALDIIDEAARFVEEKLGDSAHWHYSIGGVERRLARTLGYSIDIERQNVLRLLGELMHDKPKSSLFDRLMKAKCKDSIRD